ncbi:MAG: hypothetical protein KAX36_03035 [Thermoflexales bacterium]|nr:hypothetical protein [Thermoflexales bacterium]
MADREQILKALRAAHAAGNADHAKRLAAMLKQPVAEKSPAMADGLASLSAMTQDPAAAVDAEAYRNQSWGDWAKGQIVGDPNDNVQNAGESVGTWVNRAGETMTLGTVGDEASAAAYSALPGRTYESELSRFRGNEDNMSPTGRISADIFGAVLPALTGIGLATKAPTVLGAMGRGAAIGGAQGATMGFMEGEGGAQDRASNALTSGALGAALGGTVGPALGALGDKVGQGLANRRAIAEAIKGAPTTDALRAAGNAAYKAVDDAGVVVKPEAFAGMAGEVTGAMRRGGLDEGMGSLTPQAARVASIMDDTVAKNADTGIPFSEIDLLRRKAGVPASNVAVPLEGKLGSQAIDGMDDFINKLTPDQVVSGDAAALPALIGKARETWTRMSKSQKIDDAIENSRNYLSGEASGIRNQFAALLKNPKTARGFSDLEKEAMRKVINGSVPEKLLNLMGGGIGQTATMGMGAGMGGTPGFLLGAGIATGARKGSEALANKNAEIVRALVAGGKAGAVPQISQQPRAVIEALIRRSGEVGRQ